MQRRNPHPKKIMYIHIKIYKIMEHVQIKYTLLPMSIQFS